MLNPFRFVLSSAALFAAVALVAPSGPAFAADEPEVGKRWALLIGVDDYVSLRKLHHCVDDMQALRDQLVACGFPAEQVYLLRDKADDAARLPTKRNIELQLALLLSLVKKNDLIFVAFAGHGVQLGEKSYWCPTEALINSTAGDDEASATLVGLDGIYKQLEQCPAALRLIVVDACRDDPRRSGRTTGAPLSTDGLVKALENPPEGIVVLNSCGKDEKSQEDPKLKHGVFTHYLLEGLKGKADRDADRRISLGELWEYAGEKTQKHVADVFRDFQRPKLKGELTASVMRFPITPIVLPPESAIAPFDAPTARAHQVEWARHLGVPVESPANTIGMKFALLPAGEFLMGSTDGDDAEKPQHKVRITKPFYLGSTEVTQGQWESVMGTKPWSGKDYVQEGANNAATYVSWDDAVEFCRKLSAKEGKQYRLPTEAEWEYACRAGTTTKYGFDDESRLSDHAWWGGIIGDGNAKTEQYAHAVAGKRANAWGLFDMHGNVWEWCSDWNDEKYYGGSPGSDPSGPVTGSLRVLRGGCWYYTPADCRSAYRNWDTPVNRDYGVGFRVALVP